MGAGELGLVNDVGPVDQLAQRRRVKAKVLLADVGDELGAGAVAGVVELLGVVLLAEVLGVAGAEEGALVVIEPPRDAGIGAVFEVHDGVIVAGELVGLEKIRGLVRQPAVLEAGLAARMPV